jgi:hypothetical protein
VEVVVVGDGLLEGFEFGAHEEVWMGRGVLGVA